MSALIEIDGSAFDSLETFFEHFGTQALTAPWGRNLDAFNDVLRGGFGTPADGFTLRWRNHAMSRNRLGYPETVRQLQLRLLRCHPTHRATVAEALLSAEKGIGPTVFDWLLQIIRDHGPNGSEAEDNVLLDLQ
jgi:RNAse (barnase) inhibitor barstar